MEDLALLTCSTCILLAYGSRKCLAARARKPRRHGCAVTYREMRTRAVPGCVSTRFLSVQVFRHMLSLLLLLRTNQHGRASPCSSGRTNCKLRLAPCIRCCKTLLDTGLPGDLSTTRVYNNAKETLPLGLEQTHAFSSGYNSCLTRVSQPLHRQFNCDFRFLLR